MLGGRGIRTHHFHLVPEQVIDSIASLPDESNLMTEDGEVADEASSRWTGVAVDKK